MMRPSFSTVLALSALAAAASPASAAFLISDAPTHNVTCGAGICTATAQDAVLKIADLKDMLAGSSVAVVAGEAAQDIIVGSTLAWPGATSLTLEATRGVQIAARLTVGAAQGLAITTYAGAAAGAPLGSFSVAAGGRIRFEDLQSPLSIDGQPYVLVANATSLAIAAAAAPGGSFALADNYNSHATEGTFPASPVSVPFAGRFEGLGNAITYLAVNTFVSGNSNPTGLFATVLPTATVENLVLHDARIRGDVGPAGAVAGSNAGTLSGLAVDGEVKNPSSGTAGGLAGESSGVIVRCSASASVTANSNATLGGLVGELDPGGSIDQSFATGTVQSGPSKKSGGPANGGSGGLVGYAAGAISNSYASGLILVPQEGRIFAGGLIGIAANPVTTSYTTGTFQYSYQAAGAFTMGVNAFIGDRLKTAAASAPATPECSACYWDTTTTDVTHSIFGRNTPEIVGLTSTQLAAGLPAGFDSTIWTETAAINGGLPYLIANPPR